MSIVSVGGAAHVDCVFWMETGKRSLLLYSIQKECPSLWISWKRRLIDSAKTVPESVRICWTPQKIVTTRSKPIPTVESIRGGKTFAWKSRRKQAFHKWKYTSGWWKSTTQRRNRQAFGITLGLLPTRWQPSSIRTPWSSTTRCRLGSTHLFERKEFGNGASGKLKENAGEKRFFV